jgi:acyl carrier protein
MPANRSPVESARPSRESILEDVKRIVAEEVGMAPEQIRESSELEADLGFDSLTQVEVAMEVEDHFDITVPDEIGEQARTVGDIVEGVWKLLGEPRAQ